MKSNVIKNIFIALCTMFLTVSCEKDNSVLIEPGHFAYFRYAEKIEDFIDLEIHIIEPIYQDSKKGKIELDRFGNIALLKGIETFKQKNKIKSPGISEFATVSVDLKSNSLIIDYPQKGSDEYTDAVCLRDIISIVYDSKEDALLVKVKTPLRNEDGESPTYKLKRTPREYLPFVD